MWYHFDNMVYAIIVGILIFISGTILGSITTFLSYRIPKEKSLLTLSFRCDHCQEKISLRDSIPLINYVVLGRKCRLCKGKIPFSYFFIELLCGALSVLTFLCIGYSWQLLLYLLLIPILMAVSLIDLETGEIPYLLIFATVGLGLLSFLIPNDMPWYEHIIGMVVISVPFAVIAYFGAMGGGDVLLMAAAGLLLGWNIVPAALIGIVLGALYGGLATFISGLFSTKKTTNALRRTIKDWYTNVYRRGEGVPEGEKLTIHGECLHGDISIDRDDVRDQEWISYEDWRNLEREMEAIVSKKSHYHFHFTLDENSVNDVQCKKAILFGPFLSIGIFISALLGDHLIHWYLGLLG